MTDPFTDLPRNHFGAILADPPWHFKAWASPPYRKLSRTRDYETMAEAEISSIPLMDFSRDDCVLFLWTCWPVIEQSFRVIKQWGFNYKTCAFCWIKGNATQLEMFKEDLDPDMLLGYWTRSNSEVCLLATRGNPKRMATNVKQAIVAPRREHSSKPDGIHERIERLVAGPYLELFARQSRPGWTTWGNERTKFDKVASA